MSSQKSGSFSSISSWALLPLRLFLGITFVYAGIQKFTDPQFFHAETPGYIGKQLMLAANGSPLQAFLIHVAAPHALVIGFLVAYGEIAIGLGTLFGVLFRPAAFFGLLLSLLLYLSISWHVYPYFYGADIVFAFGWLTLFLNGPLGTGLPCFDELLALSLVNQAPARSQPRLAQRLSWLLGIPQALTLPGNQAIPTTKRRQSVQRIKETRRSFLFGVLGGGAGVLAFLGSFYAVSKSLEHAPAPAAGSTASASPTAVANGTTATPAAGTIAQVSAVPVNSAVTFPYAQSNNPGVLVHTKDDKFVAFDSTCTHAGCQVDYDPTQQLLVCPCHGAEFDPTQQASPVRGPANAPLTAIAIQVDSATGAITLR